MRSAAARHFREWAQQSAFARGRRKSMAEDKDLEKDDLLDLWKYFQNRADMLKERQWTIGTWIVTLLSGVAAFSLNQKTLSITRTGVAIGKPLPALAIGVVGMLICGYGWVVTNDYGKHIRRNWDRAERVKEQIIGLDAFWKGDNPDSQQSRRGLPRESIYLRVIVVGFLILFAGIGFISLMTAFCR
jgi:hypothetical protein